MIVSGISPEEEKILISKSIEGCEISFEKLINDQKYQVEPLRQYFSHIVDEEFKECFQLATIKCFKNLTKFNFKSSFSTWFYIIFKNELLSFINRKNKISFYEQKIEDIPSLYKTNDRVENFINKVYFKNNINEETPFSIIEKREKLQEYKSLLEACLDKIEPKYKEIIDLALIQEKSRKEIAEILKIPLGSVLSRIFIARKKAQRLILNYTKTNNIKLFL